MAVFTTVTEPQAADWLLRYRLGRLTGLEGIASGIENTNYFLSTDGGPNAGRYVLTLFEKLTAAELPFYLGLMAHLAAGGVPVPEPMPDASGGLFGTLNGKPAAVVARLSGSSVAEPALAHCAAVGQVLARMHEAGRSYRVTMDNPRGPRWWSATAPRLRPFMPPTEWAMLEAEIREQADGRGAPLARGPIHADLFRDNVLFEHPNGGEPRVSGVIDFYFACTDALLFDVAVAVNDWCRADFACPALGLDAARARALLEGYAARRPFGPEDRAAWPLMLRAGALRFWVSRLFDFHLPRPGELVHAHDPGHFRDLLAWHLAHPGRVPLP